MYKMNLITSGLIAAAVCSLTLLSPTSAATNLDGRILIQVESNGEAWYVNPDDSEAYFMGRPIDALDLMQMLGLGITTENLERIAIAGSNQNNDEAFARSLSGKILLQVEGLGQAWYVSPVDLQRYSMGSPSEAFDVLRSQGLGISEENFSQVQKTSMYLRSMESFLKAKDEIRYIGEVGGTAKARDARRLSDIKQIQTALELHFADNGSYPVETSVVTLGEGGASALTENGFERTYDIGDSIYMGLVPKEYIPEIVQNYTYKSIDGSNYEIYFQIESTVANLSGVLKATPAGITETGEGKKITTEYKEEILLDGRIYKKSDGINGIARFSIVSPISTDEGYYGKGEYYRTSSSNELLTPEEYIRTIDYIRVEPKAYNSTILTEMELIRISLEEYFSLASEYPSYDTTAVENRFGWQPILVPGTTELSFPEGFSAGANQTSLIYKGDVLSNELFPIRYENFEESYAITFFLGETDDYQAGSYRLTPNGIEPLELFE